MPLGNEQFAELVRRFDVLERRFDALLEALAAPGVPREAGGEAAPTLRSMEAAIDALTAPPAPTVAKRRGIDQLLRAPPGTASDDEREPRS